MAFLGYSITGITTVCAKGVLEQIITHQRPNRSVKLYVRALKPINFQWLASGVLGLIGRELIVDIGCVLVVGGLNAMTFKCRHSYLKSLKPELCQDNIN